MHRKRILLVSNVDAPFVRNDVPILASIGDVQPLFYRGRKDLPRLIASVARSDVVICWFVLGYATTSVLLCRILRRPCLLIAGGWDVVGLPEIGYGAMLSPVRVIKTKYALRHASRIAAVSEFTKKEVQRWVTKEITVIHNGVDTEYFSPNGFRTNQVLMVGGVDSDDRYRIKGVDVFLLAAKSIPNVPFVLVGRNSPEWERRLVKEAPSNVQIRGQVTIAELRSLYCSSRVYVQLSAYESFGVALAEAMSCACVPVVCNRAALPDVVGDAGYLVPCGDMEAVVAGIRQALHDTSTGPRARERILANFSLKTRKDFLEREVQALIEH